MKLLKLSCVRLSTDTTVFFVILPDFCGFFLKIKVSCFTDTETIETETFETETIETETIETETLVYLEGDMKSNIGNLKELRDLYYTVNIDRYEIRTNSEVVRKMICSIIVNFKNDYNNKKLFTDDDEIIIRQYIDSKTMSVKELAEYRRLKDSYVYLTEDAILKKFSRLKDKGIQEGSKEYLILNLFTKIRLEDLVYLYNLYCTESIAECEEDEKDIIIDVNMRNIISKFSDRKDLVDYKVRYENLLKENEELKVIIKHLKYKLNLQ